MQQTFEDSPNIATCNIEGILNDKDLEVQEHSQLLEPQYHLHTQTWSQNLISSYFCALMLFLSEFPTTYNSIISMLFKYVLLPMILTSSNAPFNAWVSMFAWYGSPSYYGFFLLVLGFFLLLFHLYVFVLVCLILHTYIFVLYVYVYLIYIIVFMCLCLCYHLFLVIFKLAISMWRNNIGRIIWTKHARKVILNFWCRVSMYFKV